MSDDVPLSFYPSCGLYLKLEARIHIEVRLPEIRNPGVTVSNWEVMEKIKHHSEPEDYLNLRVALTSRELIRFEGEFESVRALRKVILLLNGKTIKLRGFSDPLKMKARQAEEPYPTKTAWEEYFISRGVDTFDEGRPGERPDTIHVMGLPVRWFISKSSDGRPCPKALTQAFQKFGKVRQVGFYDPSVENVSKGFSSFGPGAGTETLNFEAYIQYEKYGGFCNAMTSLKGMQLMRLQAGGQAVVKIKVDFDRTGFLSDRGIRKRLHLEEKRRKELEEEEMIKKQKKLEEERKKMEELKAKEKEEEEKRLKRLEEKQQKKKKQEEIVSQLRKIAIQRRVEAQRLMSVLLAEAAEARYQGEMREKEAKIKEDNEKERMQRQIEETKLRDSLLQNVHQLEQRRLALHKEIASRRTNNIHRERKK